MTSNGTAEMVLSHGAAAMARAPEPMEFTADQRRMIRDTFANGASEGEFEVLLEVARARRLNPLLRQIHFVKRWDRQKNRDVWSTQVSIDGLRAIAERTGKYNGQDEPEFTEGPQGVAVCKVRVYRKDWTRPAVGVAYWDEYVQTTKDNRPTQFWSRMPHVMLAKCAEALALRKAFPEDMSGLYVAEEMPEVEPVASPPMVQDFSSREPVPSPMPKADAALFEAICEGVDAAESGSALNAIARSVQKHHQQGVFSAEQFERVKAAVKAKRAWLDTKPAETETREPGEEG